MRRLPQIIPEPICVAQNSLFDSEPCTQLCGSQRIRSPLAARAADLQFRGSQSRVATIRKEAPGGVGGNRTRRSREHYSGRRRRPRPEGTAPAVHPSACTRCRDLAKRTTQGRRSSGADRACARCSPETSPVRLASRQTRPGRSTAVLSHQDRGGSRGQSRIMKSAAGSRA